MKFIRKYENLLLYAAPLVVVVAGSLLFYLHHHKSNTTKPSPTPTPVASTAHPNPTPDVPKSSPGTTNTTADVGLMAPSGDFVSNHSPTLSNQYGRGIESSVCRTTVGAKCRIEFSKNSIIKTLSEMEVTPAKDSQVGTVIWDNWTPNSLGLDSGQWQITAIATLGDQTKSTKDPTGLNVQP